jgi:hypothetical protein
MQPHDASRAPDAAVLAIWLVRALLNRTQGGAPALSRPVVRLRSAAAGRDTGVEKRVLARIRERLDVDARWTTRGERSLTWIGNRLGQKVVVGLPSRIAAEPVTPVRVATTVANDVRASEPDVIAYLARLNWFAVGSAYVFDPAARTIELVAGDHVSVPLERERCNDLADYAVLQLAQAEREADRIADALGARVAERDHTARRARRISAAPLDVVRTRFLPDGPHPSGFRDVSRGFSLAKLNLDGRCAGVTRPDGTLSIHAPFGERETIVIRCQPNVRHPWLGAGMVMFTTIPWLADDATLARTASELQRAQLDSSSASAMLGAWGTGALDGRQCVAFARFVPNAMYRADVLDDAVREEVKRAAWLDRHYFPGLAPRSVWQIWAAMCEPVARAAGAMVS